MQNNNVIYSMFNLGTGELVLIFLVILLLFGAKRLPDLAKGLGKGMRTLKNASNDIKTEIQRSAEKQGIDTDLTKDINEEINKVKEEIEDLTGSVRRKL